MIALLLVGGFVLAAIGTWLLRRYALARSVLDIPNSRSSHQLPTPRGGGLSIVVVFLVGAVVLAFAGVVPLRLAIALVGAGSAVALVGFIDDHRHIAAGWRLLAHFASAAWALWWLGGMPPTELAGAIVNLGWAGSVAAIVALVWLLNLYNFMDGIDGIAGVETICVSAGAMGLFWFHPIAGREWVLPALLAASTLGFLVWNFPRARIFMGDAGSGFLGITLGILALRGARLAPEWLWSWIILLGVFVVDATVTLLRRLQRGEKVYEAHRSHAYQQASRRWGSHRPVTLAVAAINLLWLLPLALLVATNRLGGVTGVFIAYAPLIGLAFRLRAGRPA